MCITICPHNSPLSRGEKIGNRERGIGLTTCSSVFPGKSVGIKGWNGAERQTRSDGLCDRSKEQANWICKWYEIGSCREHRGRHSVSAGRCLLRFEWVDILQLWTFTLCVLWLFFHSLPSDLLVAVLENSQWWFHCPFNKYVPKMFLPFFTPRKDTEMKIKIIIVFL